MTNTHPDGHSTFVIHHSSFPLLLLLRVHRVLAQPRAELADLQLFATRFALDRVVVVAGFLAHEEHGFNFLLSFTSHESTYRLVFNETNEASEPGRPRPR